MTANTARIADIRDHIVTQIVLDIERVVFNVLGGHIVGKATQVSVANGGQAGGGKRRNGVGICRVTVVVVRAARDRVDDIRVDLEGVFAGTGDTDRSGRVAVVVVCGCDLLAVIVQAETTAKNRFALEHTRGPVKAKLRSKVQLLRNPLADTGLEGNSCQQACAAAENKHTHVVVLIGERSEVGVAQSGA